MEAKMDLTMFKEIPGYKAILKAVLKAQMQMLVDQLSEVEEESVILTASLSDGTLSYLGSLPGKTFLDGREEIKSQFLFHCLKRKTSTPVPTSDSLFVAGQSGTTMPNREPVFIPGGAGQGIPGQDQMFTDLRPLDSRSHHLESRSPHDERAAKKPRRTLPDVPSLFGQGSELPAQFQPDMEASIQYQRGRGRARGALLGPGRGMVVPQGGPFGRGIVIGSVGSMGQGLSVGRGSPAGRGPTGRGAGSGRSRRARGQFPTRGRGRGVKRGATATVTSPDEVSVTSTADLDNVNKIEPDLVTVKAENFEVSIDLNSPVVKHIDATPVNIDMSPSVKLKRLPKPKQSDSSKKTSTPKKHSSDTDQKHGEKTKKDNSNGDIDNEIEKQDSVEQDNDDAFNDSTDEENDASEVPLDDYTKTKSADNSVNDSNVDTDDNSHNMSHVSIKQEVQDVEELLGMEAGALQESYRAPGPNGDRLNQTWGIMESGSMGSDGFDGGTPGPSHRGEEGTQSSGNSVAIPPVYKYLDQYGNVVPGSYRKNCAVKRKFNEKTIEQKYAAILDLEKGALSKTEMARKLQVGQSTITGWVKGSEAIKTAYRDFISGKRKRAKKGKFQELEAELAKWCKSMLGKDVQLTGPIVMERVQQIVLELGIKDCKPSTGWLERFKGRHGITFKKPQASGEAGSANDTNAEPIDNAKELSCNNIDQVTQEIASDEHEKNILDHETANNTNESIRKTQVLVNNDVTDALVIAPIPASDIQEAGQILIELETYDPDPNAGPGVQFVELAPAVQGSVRINIKDAGLDGHKPVSNIIDSVSNNIPDSVSNNIPDTSLKKGESGASAHDLLAALQEQY